LAWSGLTGKELNMGSARLERIGAVAGILFFVAVVANFLTPETPDADDPNVTIVQELADDRTGHIASVYLNGLAAIFFVLFAAGLWALLRRAETERGASVLVLLGGVASSAVILVAGTVYYALVNAADDARGPVAVRALFELQETVFLAVGWTLAIFYAGAALSSLGARSLPAWLTWPAALLAVLFPICLLGLFSEEDEGGVLGGIFFIALVVNFLWILAASIVMFRARPVPGPATTAPPPT
jgi:hypothetical protein